MSASPEKRPARGSIRKPVLLGLFTGTAVGAGYLLAGVPNVELMSLLIALAGGALGAGFGAVCGAIAAVLYSLGSPFGAPVPLLLAAQAVGFAWMGVAGALGAGRITAALRGGARRRAAWLAAVVALAGTTGHEILTNLAIVGAFDLEPRVVLLGAVPFYLVHCGANVAIFTLLLPLLLPRLRGLARPPLRGHGPAGAVVLVAALGLLGPASGARAQDMPRGRSASGAAHATADTTAVVAAPDSARAAAVEETPAGPRGWKRPLWDPFLGALHEELLHRSPYVPATAGGLGAAQLLMGAGPANDGPRFVRDGIPLGTGHVLADDPWLIPTMGVRPASDLYGADGWGGTAGRIDLERYDPDPRKAVSIYRGRKGPHDSYLRGVSLLSPRAEWRVGFDFDESLDNESYNWIDSTEKPEGDLTGHAKIRSSHFELTRRIDERSRVTLHYLTGRKTRDELPVWDVEQQEIWEQGIGVRSEGARGPWRWDSSWFWNDRDVKWGTDAAFASGSGDLRLIETGREGASAELSRATAAGRFGLQARIENWEVQDTGGDGFAQTSAQLRGEGQRGRLGAVWRRGFLGAARLEAQGGMNWDSRLTPAPDWQVRLSAREREGQVSSVQKPRPGWEMGIAGDGRAPRSDEWLTPVRRSIGGEDLLLRPNAGLTRENQQRAWMALSRRLPGIEVAVEAGWTRLRDGITWAEVDTLDGVWTNGLEMDALRVSVGASRQGELWGVYRIGMQSTWQSFDEKAAAAAALPPERFDRLHVLWENHLFSGDGVLEVGWWTTRRGAMDDPWDVTRSTRLPSLMLHDLMLGFRLVGVHLSLAWRNLTDQRVEMANGVLTSGREQDMRLYWLFRH